MKALDSGEEREFFFVFLNDYETQRKQDADMSDLPANTDDESDEEAQNEEITPQLNL